MISLACFSSGCTDVVEPEDEAISEETHPEQNPNQRDNTDSQLESGDEETVPLSPVI